MNNKQQSSISQKLAEMAKEDLHPIDAIRRLVEECGIGLGDAKQMLLEHPDWQETRDAHAATQNDIEAGLKS